MIHDDATDDDDDLRQGSAIRAVKQPFKFAARRGDWDDCLVAFSDLINIMTLIKMIEMEMRLKMVLTSAVTIPGAAAMPSSWTPRPANTNVSSFHPAWSRSS